MALDRFARYAWFVVGWNVLVILWGAFVRATGSGAGCGSHWPLCNGEVLPANPSVARLIEFTHRSMSGIALLLVLGMIVWAFRAYPWGRIRYGALASGAFIITEALLGAALVLFGWVGLDQSTMRVYSVGLHLVNTFFLLGALTLTAWWASGGRAIDLRTHRLETALLGLGLLGIMVIGMTGAITALGDTLFPAASLAQGIEQDLSPTAHFLVQLRVVHPLVAVSVSLFLFYLTTYLKGAAGTTARKLAMALRLLVVTQVLAGLVNILLLAPTWMQIVHLGIADLVWMVMLLYAASLLAAQGALATDASRPRGAVRAPANSV